METLSSLSSFPLISPSSFNSSINTQTHLNNPSSIIINHKLRKQCYVKVRELNVRVKAIDDVSRAIGDPAEAQLTWQIIVGSLGLSFTLKFFHKLLNFFIIIVLLYPTYIPISDGSRKYMQWGQ